MDPIVQGFLELAERQPRAQAAVAPGLSWTREDLGTRVRAVGSLWQALMQEHRLAPGTVIALLVEPGPGFLVAFLALRMAESCVLLLDSALTDEEQQRIASSIGAAGIWRSALSCGSDPANARDIDWLPGRTRLPETACLKLTSGSSGDPAGVMIPTRSLLEDGWNLIRSMDLREEDRLLATIPLSHSYGLSVVASPAWLLGCAVVFPGEMDPLEAAREFEASFLPSVPSWFEAQLSARNPAPLPKSLRLLMSAGAPLRPASAKAWIEQHGLGIHVLYGSSECGGITYDQQGDAACSGSVGTAVNGVRVELDSQGRVIVHSKATALGYWPVDEEKATRLQDDCFFTDDVGQFDGDRLTLLGRRSGWINVKGNKVNPREVEGVLCEHPSIDDAAVLGRRLPDGRGESIRAFVACRDASLHFRDILQWCRPRLARHKYPRSLVMLPAIPRTERGKVDRRALEEL